MVYFLWISRYMDYGFQGMSSLNMKLASNGVKGKKIYIYTFLWIMNSYNKWQVITNNMFHVEDTFFIWLRLDLLERSGRVELYQLLFNLPW